MTRTLLLLLCAAGCSQSGPTPDLGSADAAVDAWSPDAWTPPDAGWPPTCTEAGAIVCGWRLAEPAIPIVADDDGFHGASLATFGPHSVYRLDATSPWSELTTVDGTTSEDRPWVFEMAGGVRTATFADGVLTVRDLAGEVVETVGVARAPSAVVGAGEEIVLEVRGESTSQSRLAVYRDGELQLETEEGPRGHLWPRDGGRPLVSRYEHAVRSIVFGEVGAEGRPLDTSTCDEPVGDHALLPLTEGLAWAFRCGEELHLTTRIADAETSSVVGVGGSGAIALGDGAGALIVMDVTETALRVQLIDARTHRSIAAGELPFVLSEEHGWPWVSSALELSRARHGVFTVRSVGALPEFFYAPDEPMLAVCEICD